MNFISKNQYNYLIRLSKNTHFKRKEGKAMVEGEKVIRDLVQNAPHVIEYIVISPKVQNKFKFSRTLYIKESGIHRLSNRRGGFKAAALINVSELQNTEITKLEKGVYIALDNIQNPENLGMIFRTSLAFGVKGIFLLDSCVSPMNQKSIDASTGSVFNVPYTQLDSFDTLKALKTEDTQFISTEPHAKKSYKDMERTGTTVMFFGNEGSGLDAGTLSKMDYSVGINIKSIDSLNVAVSQGIILAHLLGS